MDQKVESAYLGFYNGGGSRRGHGQGVYGDVSLSVGSRGRALVAVLDEPEAEAKCEITVQLLTFSCRKFRI